MNILETLKIPKGYNLDEISNLIIQYIIKYGDIKIKKLYYNSNKLKYEKNNELKLLKWNLIDCFKVNSQHHNQQHNLQYQNLQYQNQEDNMNKKDTTLENKMLVDVLNFAWERISRHINTTVVLITIDEDYSYLISKLRDIGVKTILIHGYVKDTSDILLDCCDISLCWDEIFNFDPVFDVIDIDVSECISEISEFDNDDNDDHDQNNTSLNQFDNSLEVEYDINDNEDEELLFGEQIETDHILIKNKNSSHSIILSPSDILTLNIEINQNNNQNNECNPVDNDCWNPSLDEPILNHNNCSNSTNFELNHNNFDNINSNDNNSYSLFSPSFKEISSPYLFDSIYTNDNFRHDYYNSQNQVTSLTTSPQSSFLNNSPSYNLWQSLPSNDILKLIHHSSFSAGG